MDRGRESSFRFTRQRHMGITLSGASTAALVFQAGCGGPFGGMGPSDPVEAGVAETVVVEASAPDAGPEPDSTGRRDGRGTGRLRLEAEARGRALPATRRPLPTTTRASFAETYGIFVAPVTHGGDDASGSGTREKNPTPHSPRESPEPQPRGSACTRAEPTIRSSSSWVCPSTARASSAGSSCPGAGAVDGATGPWSYSGAARDGRTGSPARRWPSPALVTGAHFEDMAFVVPPATDAGGSSIAIQVMVSDGVSFLRVAETAGQGGAGAAGRALPSNACTTPTMSGAVATSVVGGTAGACTCPVSGSSTGGNGGPATGQGQTAGNGAATPATTAMLTGFNGRGGLGWHVAFSMPYPATSGETGANGSPNAGGEGSGLGSLVPAGWTPLNGGDGSAGNPGQGGGGGGGNFSLPLGGASGGAGGCGGNGGGGGGGGGASIAVAVDDEHCEPRLRRSPDVDGRRRRGGCSR